MAEAIQERDRAFDALFDAVREVDRVHDRIVTDYEDAERERLQRRGQ